MTLEQSDLLHVVERLHTNLNVELPGLRGHAALAPRPRRPLLPAKDQLRQAAGLLLLYPIENIAHTLLTVRAGSLPQHSGQVSLPGGAIEENETFEQAALRENAREIAIVAKELTRRFQTLLEHLEGINKGLNQARNHWNKFVSSYERRFLPQAKKLSDLDVWENVPELDRLDVDTRELPPSEVEQAISSNGHKG